MESPTLIDPLPPSTPSERKLARGPRHDLPADLLRDASNRLSITALVGGVLWLGGSILAHLTGSWTTHDHEGHLSPIDYLGIPDLFVAGIVAVSFGLFFYARNSTPNPRF